MVSCDHFKDMRLGVDITEQIWHVRRSAQEGQDSYQKVNSSSCSETTSAMITRNHFTGIQLGVDIFGTRASSGWLTATSRTTKCKINIFKLILDPMMQSSRWIKQDNIKAVRGNVKFLAQRVICPNKWDIFHINRRQRDERNELETKRVDFNRRDATATTVWCWPICWLVYWDCNSQTSPCVMSQWVVLPLPFNSLSLP